MRHSAKLNEHLWFVNHICCTTWPQVARLRVYLVLRSLICPTWTDAQCTAVAPIMIKALLSPEVARRLAFTTDQNWSGLKAQVVARARSTDNCHVSAVEFARCFNRYSPPADTLVEEVRSRARDSNSIMPSPIYVPHNCSVCDMIEMHEYEWSCRSLPHIYYSPFSFLEFPHHISFYSSEIQPHLDISTIDQSKHERNTRQKVCWWRTPNHRDQRRHR